MNPHICPIILYTRLQCSDVGGDVTASGEGGNNVWRRKEAGPQQPSGRFQLVMETGVAHPAAVVTDLTCPSDTHFHSFSAQKLYSVLPLPHFQHPFLNFIFLFFFPYSLLQNSFLPFNLALCLYKLLLLFLLSPAFFAL